ncbi:hypothetical protein DERP_012992 [Dermatophagoides pteronyssinus]|uniref:Uncharacterized protein n=1 Tax=Dermatophagoides pteronyssinus TaxID=6956 RepID=A0ABQ8ISI2_DERPT|nr:hypothetical protein DERP_012992 [Dermatophagoides pteronyssinus]
MIGLVPKAKSALSFFLDTNSIDETSLNGCQDSLRFKNTAFGFLIALKSLTVEQRHNTARLTSSINCGSRFSRILLPRRVLALGFAIVFEEIIKKLSTESKIERE